MFHHPTASFRTSGRAMGNDRPDKGLNQRMVLAAQGRAFGLEKRSDKKRMRRQFGRADFAPGVEAGEMQPGGLEFRPVRGVEAIIATILPAGRAPLEDLVQARAGREND